MKNTRNNDLGVLEEARDQATSDNQKKHLQAILENVYEQSKDTFLEKMRVQLEDAIKRGDHMEMERIRKKVQDYARSPVYIKETLKKIKKSTDEQEGKLFIHKTFK